MTTRKMHNGAIDSQILHGDERHNYGVTVTFANRSLTRFQTVSCKGLVVAALAEVLDRVPHPMSVVCISTPNTVFRDLVGPPRPMGAQPIPEQMLLGRVRARGRLHPSLWPRSNDSRPAYAAAYAREEARI